MTERIARIRAAVLESLNEYEREFIDEPIEEIPIQGSVLGSILGSVLESVLGEGSVASEGVRPAMMKLIKYYQLHRDDIHAPVAYTPGEIKISTISSACYVSKSRIFNLDLLNDYLQYGEPDFSGMELEMVEAAFGNSLSMEMNLIGEKKVKLTFFQNGRITIAGANTDDYGYRCAVRLLEVIKGCPDTFYGVDPHDIEIENYRMTMINCDYDVGFDLDLDLLFAILIEKHPYFVTYNNEMYQGIKLHYMWRHGNRDDNGVCRCVPSCFAKKLSANNGSGFLEDHDCREISVAIFSGQPCGKVIITGACDFDQVADIRNDINRLLRTHYHEIKRFVLDQVA